MADESKDETSPDRSPLLEKWDELRENPWIRWGMDLTFFALIFLAVTMFQTRHLLDDGQPAPDVALRTMDVQPAALSDYSGKQTIVIFWAPWCGVCGAESDNVSRVDRWLGDRAHVVGVALDYQSRADVQDFIDEHDVTYPVLMGGRDAAKAFNISAFPTTYVLDEEGRVEHTAVGYTTTFGLLWRAII